MRSVGELVQNKYRIGLMRTERIMKDIMTVMDLETVTPAQLINCRPITAALREFFAQTSCHTMDQTNPLSELAHKRRLSAMGPGGLSRERASFDVRDAHQSLRSHLSDCHSRRSRISVLWCIWHPTQVNSYGFTETPYYEVKALSWLKWTPDAMLGRIVDVTVKDGRKVFAKEGDKIETKQMAHQNHLAAQNRKNDRGSRRAYVIEKKCTSMPIANVTSNAEANSALDERGEFIGDARARNRKRGEPVLAHVRDVTHTDIHLSRFCRYPPPFRSLSTMTTRVRPWNEHATSGCSAHRSTLAIRRHRYGKRRRGASGHVIVAGEEGGCSQSMREVTVMYRSGRKAVAAHSTTMSAVTGGTCFHAPARECGRKVRSGDVICRRFVCPNGRTGSDLLVAYMP